MRASVLLLLGSFFAAEAHASQFAAIAYSRSTGKYGYSYQSPSYQAVVSRAMSECRQRGAHDCELAIWVQDGCVALAKDYAGYWGVGYANGHNYTQAFSPAQERSVQDCRRFSPTGDCYSETVQCSF